jgi:hypothetical protein
MTSVSDIVIYRERECVDVWGGRRKREGEGGRGVGAAITVIVSEGGE